MDDHNKDIVAPIKHRDRMASRKTFAIIAAICLLIIVYVVIGKSSYKKATETSYSTEVEALSGIEVKYSDSEIVVLNTSEDSWENCSPIGLGRYFFGNAPSILSHDELSMPYREFTARGGVRLDTETIKPTMFTIQCDINGVNHASAFVLE